MSNLRRCFVDGYPYFITAVTYDRLPLLVQDIDLFHVALKRTQRHLEFDLLAWVVLPDHCHILVDSRGHDLSGVMHKFKLSFSGLWRHRHRVSSARIWQYRFWDHGIRNQADFDTHLNYIHYNPVKHGCASSPAAWPHSSFDDFVSRGFYDPSWGRTAPRGVDGEFGE